MAITATAFLEIEAAGSDTANSGGFDPAATFPTDLAIVSGGNTAAPVVSSASYNFVAGDNNAWLFIKSGTNLIPGWYKISSTASNQATLDATIGHALLWPTLVASTVAGCATTATQAAGGTWGLDYSQQTAAKVTYTDLVIGGTTTQLTSAAHPFGVNHVGNVINITGGTGFTVQRLVVNSVSGTTATCNASAGTAASSAGTGNLGGAFATLDAATTAMVGSNSVYVQGGTNYSEGIGFSLPVGTSTAPTRLVGYTTYRGDNGQATIQASANISFIINVPNNWCCIYNLVLDANAHSVGTHLKASANNSLFSNINIKGVTTNNTGLQSGANTCHVRKCYATIAAAGSNANLFFANGAAYFEECVADGAGGTGGNSHGFNDGGFTCTFLRCISRNISGDGLFTQGSAVESCISHNNSVNGVNNAGGISSVRNCILHTNATAFNYSSGALVGHGADYNFLWNNTANYSAGLAPGVHDVILTGDPFVSASGGNYALNNTTGAGAAVRAAGAPGAGWQVLGTTAYLDGGAAQHQDTGGSGGYAPWVS